MDIPKSKIKSLGKPYFSEEFLKEFIATIERIAPNPDKYFLQLTQQKDKPIMEFGCKAGRILLNLAASSEAISTYVVLFSTVNAVVLRELPNSMRLWIITTSTARLNHIAVTDVSRDDLRKYAEFLQESLSSK